MQTLNSGRKIRPVVEAMERRMLASVSPNLAGQTTFPTHTELTVDSGTLGQPITFDVTVLSENPVGSVNLYSRGKLLQQLFPVGVSSPNPRVPAVGATYTIPAGAAAAESFGVGPHEVRALFVGTQYQSYPSSAVTAFRVTRPQFVTQPSGVGVATVDAGSGPALQPGQRATVQYDAYIAAGYRLFYSTETQTPDTQTFVVGANPEQVIPGLDAGVVGMQAGETRAIYIPYALGYGKRGARPVPPRANLVYLVTLVSVG